MKIALLGTGFGQAHAAVYAERDVEVVVFGRTPARLEDVQQKFGFSTTTDLDGLYHDPSIDLIDVCLPTALHAEHVLRGLAAGKHVLCELPLALTMADAQRVTDAAAATDRLVFVDMFGRFNPTDRLLREAVAEKTYGRLQVLEMEGRTALLWPGYDLRLDTIVLDMLHGTLDSVVQVLGVPESFTTSAVTGAERELGRTGRLHLSGRGRPRQRLRPDAPALRLAGRLPGDLHRRRAGTRLRRRLHRPGGQPAGARIHRRWTPRAPGRRPRRLHGDDRSRAGLPACRSGQPTRPEQCAR